MTRQETTEAILERMNEVFRRFRHHFREPREVELFELTMSQMKALLFLEEAPAQMSKIAAALGVTLPSATGIIDRLVDRGLVSRQVDPMDRRLVICALTEAGVHLAASLYTGHRAAFSELLAALNEQELRIVLQAFSILGRAVAAGNGSVLKD